MVSKTVIDQLPSLPQVLVQILDAIHSEAEDFQAIADIIRQDAAMATRIMHVANSSYYGQNNNCQTIERALVILGTETVKTLVITASIKQFYSHFNQQHQTFLKAFWRRSLAEAQLAQVIATLTSYSLPEEAYLCGLLTDVGQLVLLTEHEEKYLALTNSVSSDSGLVSKERELFQQSHSDIGGDLISHWQLSNFMSDAVRYHHEPTNQVQDAHHLVKIVQLASLMSQDAEIDDTTLSASFTLFGLNEALTRELKVRINSDIEKIAGGLGIDLSDSATEHQEAHSQLGERLSQLGELNQMNLSLWQSQSYQSLQQAIQRSLTLSLPINKPVLFTVDPDNPDQLSASLSEENDRADFVLPIQSNRGLIANCAADQTTLDSQTAGENLSVIDKQILRHSAADILCCWPLSSEDNLLGVLAFGVKIDDFAELNQRRPLISSLCKQFAGAISGNKQRFNSLSQGGANQEEIALKIREAVHEASNPLTIIRNYLEMLRLELGEEHTANEGLELIKGEINRIGDILLRLRDPDTDQETASLNINELVENVATITRDSLCAAKGLTLELKLDEKVATQSLNSGAVKQVLTNLLKNAAEALDKGGKITVSTEHTVSVNGKDYMAIYVSDNGPGIPDSIKTQLFSPVNSTKGSDHSGLGLSIVKKLIDTMQGSIVCRSNPDNGTEFQILLPK